MWTFCFASNRLLGTNFSSKLSVSSSEVCFLAHGAIATISQAVDATRFLANVPNSLWRDSTEDVWASEVHFHLSAVQVELQPCCMRLVKRTIGGTLFQRLCVFLSAWWRQSNAFCLLFKIKICVFYASNDTLKMT